MPSNSSTADRVGGELVGLLFGGAERGAAVAWKDRALRLSVIVQRDAAMAAVQLRRRGDVAVRLLARMVMVLGTTLAKQAEWAEAWFRVAALC